MPESTLSETHESEVFVFSCIFFIFIFFNQGRLNIFEGGRQIKTWKHIAVQVFWTYPHHIWKVQIRVFISKIFSQSKVTKIFPSGHFEIFFRKSVFEKSFFMKLEKNKNKHRIWTLLTKAVIFHYFWWIFENSNLSNEEGGDFRRRHFTSRYSLMRVSLGSKKLSIRQGHQKLSRIDPTWFFFVTKSESGRQSRSL